jgi:hypothetical protein
MIKMDFIYLSPEERYELVQDKYIRSPPTPPTTPIPIDTDIKGNIVLQVVIPEIPEQEDKTVTVCVCGGKFTHFNKNRHYNTKKHRNAILSLQEQLPLSSPLLVREVGVDSSP